VEDDGENVAYGDFGEASAFDSCFGGFGEEAAAGVWTREILEVEL
jgi:hypothetical protein